MIEDPCSSLWIACSIMQVVRERVALRHSCLKIGTSPRHFVIWFTHAHTHMYDAPHVGLVSIVDEVIDSSK